MSETFNRVCTKNLTIAPQTIFTATSKTALVSAYFCNNNSNNEVDLTLYINNSSDVLLANLIKVFPIPVAGAWEAIANRIVLLTGDKLMAFCSEDNGIDVTISVVENLP